MSTTHDSNLSNNTIGSPATTNGSVNDRCLSSTCTIVATKRCSRCKTAKYCSIECQKAHWPIHRYSCVPHPQESRGDTQGVTQEKSDIAPKKETSSRKPQIWGPDTWTDIHSSRNNYRDIEDGLQSLKDMMDLFNSASNDRKTPIEGHPMRNVEDRRQYTLRYSYAIPTNDVIRDIANICLQVKDPFTLLSIGCGNAYWEHLIETYTLSIGKRCTFICVDKRISANPWCGITQDNAKNAIKKYSDADILFLCWPPLDTNEDLEENSMSSDCLLPFTSSSLSSSSADTSKTSRIKCVIYIGEPAGWCTGDAKFHQCLKEHWHLLNKIPIPNWAGIHDSVYVYLNIQ